MRHSLAPGFGDPAGWRLDSCATQRNLSEAGRAQARRVGSQLEARQLRFDLVLSSAWCRCIETAQHVTGRAPEVFAGLNSFFEDASTRPRQIADTRAKLAALPPETRVLMVTHQVVISALTGRTASSGEVIVAKRRADGSLTAVGAIMIE